MNIEELYEKYLQSRSVSTDTRQIKNGSVFFALRGEKFNGNEFALQALKIDHSVSTPFSPEQKGHIERVQGTVSVGRVAGAPVGDALCVPVGDRARLRSHRRAGGERRTLYLLTRG